MNWPLIGGYVGGSDDGSFLHCEQRGTATGGVLPYLDARGGYRSAIPQAVRSADAVRM